VHGDRRPEHAVKGLPYLLPYCVPLAVAVAWRSGDLWAFRLAPWIFLAVTVLDTFVRGRGPGDSEIAADATPQGIFWRLAIWMWLPAQTAVVLCGLLAVTGSAREWLEIVTIAVSVGMTGGMLNVPAAHELMHGRRRVERLLGEMLMLLMSYPHFCVEHLHGHHVRVATPHDPATARIGESLYAFVPRSIAGGLRSAWTLEAARMRKQQRAPLHPSNRVVRGAIGLAVLYAAIGFVFGAPGILFFALQSLIAISILESINYIQHYGLVRRKSVDGRYARVAPADSWNSSHPVSNWFLLNLGRHSDHHCDAGKDYRSLARLTAAPQLPTGLFGMFVLALFPPLWRQIMDPLVARLREESGQSAPLLMTG
jgi:alkane 1-monooxygenase